MNPSMQAHLEAQGIQVGKTTMELPKGFDAGYEPGVTGMRRRKTLTIRQVKEYLNSLPEELLDNNAAISEGGATGTLKSVGFYISGELYFRGEI